MFIKIAQSPYLNLLSGLVLLATAGYETWANIEEVSIGAHHGILIFSIVHLLKTIPEFIGSSSLGVEFVP